MRSWSRPRKKQLLGQNQAFKATQSVQGAPTHSMSVGPASGSALLPRLVPQLTGDAGLMKRFSVLGWSTGSSSQESGFPSPPSSPRQNQSHFSQTSSEAQPLQPQSTGGLWSNWWSSTGGDKSTADKGSASTVKSAKWYVDPLRSNKGPDMNLVKHLITLRVHLSTAKLPFVEELVCKEKGLEALGKLLANLVGKGGKRKRLNELETTLLLEEIKCLRVILNTEVCISCAFLEIHDAHFAQARIWRSPQIP